MPNESAKDVAIEAKHLRPNFDHVSLRPDSLAAFAAALDRRLSVVCAPAGYGKTTMTAAALDHCGKTAAWYKLDILDHDPVAFLASMIRAVRRVHPEFGAALLRELEASPVVEVPVEVLAARFCSECDQRLTADLHLVLDDYHEAMDSAAMNSVLGYLLENCPRTLRFVVLTRYEPAFRLEKLHLSGEVARLQRDLLVFDAGQVAEVLARRSGRTYEAAHIQRVLELTEGWPASVVLAGMALTWLDVGSLQDALSDPRLRGDVFSYLAEQVFQRQTEEVQLFLLGTCCLEHVTVELAEALTGPGRASRHLNFLARNHVFTFDTERRGAFRYHNLLRDFLVQRFVQDEGESAFRALQRRTAVALEDCGDRPGAIELLLSANELDLALGVIARGGEAELERCPSERLRTWAERVEPCAESEEPWALVVCAVVATRDSRFSAALEYLELASAALERTGDNRGLYQALSIKEWAEFWSGDCAASMATSSRALDLASTDAERVHTLLSLSSAALDMRRWGDVEAASAEAAKLLPRANAQDVTRAQALRAHAAFYQGDIRSARRLIEQCQDRHDTSAQQISALNTHGLVELALGEFDNASTRLQRALEVAEDFGQVIASSMVEDNLALLESSVGNFAGARKRLTLLLSRSDELDPMVLCSVLTHRGTALRREGHIRDSMEATGAAMETVSESRDPYLALNARANLAFSEGLQGAQRETQLEEISASARRAGVQFVELKAALYEAILASLSGQEGHAVRVLGECLPRQLDLGHVNLVAQELCPRPHVVASVMRTARRDLIGLPLISALSRHWGFAAAAPVLVEECPTQVVRWVQHALEIALPDRQAVGRHPSRPRLGTSQPPVPCPLDELTPKELEVLGLMAQNRSNAQIAGELYVAVSTVKTHINHILSKLQQANRIGAVLEYQRLMRPLSESDAVRRLGPTSPPGR